MANKKFSLVMTATRQGPNGEKLYRIKANKTFDAPHAFATPTGTIKKGDLGGWVESLANLSQDGTCWVAEDAVVCGKALVRDDAVARGNSIVMDRATLRDDSNIAMNAVIQDDARMYHSAQVGSTARVSGQACIQDTATVAGSAEVREEAVVTGHACVTGHALVEGSASVGGQSVVIDHGIVRGIARLEGSSRVTDNAVLSGSVLVKGASSITDNSTVGGNAELNNVVLEGNASVQSNENIFSAACDFKLSMYTTAANTGEAGSHVSKSGIAVNYNGTRYKHPVQAIQKLQKELAPDELQVALLAISAGVLCLSRGMDRLLVQGGKVVYISQQSVVEETAVRRTFLVNKSQQETVINTPIPEMEKAVNAMPELE